MHKLSVIVKYDHYGDRQWTVTTQLGVLSMQVNYSTKPTAKQVRRQVKFVRVGDWSLNFVGGCHV